MLAPSGRQREAVLSRVGVRALRLSLSPPRFGDTQLAGLGIFRRSDGMLWHMNEEREVTREEVTTTCIEGANK